MFRRQQREKYLHSGLVCPYYTTFCVNTGLTLSVSIFSPKIFAPGKSFDHGHFPHSGNLLNYLFFLKIIQQINLTKIVLAYIEAMDLPYSKISMVIVQIKYVKNSLNYLAKRIILRGLSIEIECNLKTVNYLDVTLDLNTGTYKPYRKPNDEILYIHAKSNHPANILKQQPILIETRLFNLSSNSKIFREAFKL